MEIDDLYHYCLTMPGSEGTFPFGPETLVLKVGGKIFAIIPLDSGDCRINLKATPDDCVMMREQWSDHVFPGYHMSKTHWNTVVCSSGLPDNYIKDWVRNSYFLILNRLPVATRQMIDALDRQ